MAEPITTTDTNPVPPHRSAPKKGIPKILIVLSFVLVAGIGYVAGGINSGTIGGKINTLLGREDIDLSQVQETYRALADNFDGTIDKQKLIEGANKGLVDAAGDQ